MIMAAHCRAGDPYATINTKCAQGAYVFVRPAGSWSNATPVVATLTASDGAAGDSFGYGIAVSGSKIATGAPFAAVGSDAAQVATYAFIKPSTGWKTMLHFDAKATASDGAVYLFQR